MKVAIFGSSGMARSIVDICDTMNISDLVFVDRESGMEPILGIPIVAENDIPRLEEDNYVFAMGIGDNAIRRKIAEQFCQLRFINVVHSTATFGRRTREMLDATRGNIVMAGAIFSGNIQFGHFGLYNFNCVVGHDVHFGDYVHLGPNSVVCGNVNIGDASYIWSGAMVRNGGDDRTRITIGSRAELCMGAVALNDVPEGISIPPNKIYAGKPRS